jgi:hypothetical protein
MPPLGAQSKRLLIGKILRLRSFGGSLNETFVAAANVRLEAARISSKAHLFFSKAMQFSMHSPPRARKNSLVWGENAKHAFRPQRTRTKRTFGGAATTKASAPGKTKETFPFETRALWKLVPLHIPMHTMAHLEFLRHFTHIQHVNARSLFSARLFGEMKTQCSQRWVSDGHSFVIAFHAQRENLSPHALLWA